MQTSPETVLDRDVQDGPSSWALSRAHQRSLQRTLQALFRENLLHHDHLVVDDSCAWLPLWACQKLLRLDGVQVGVAGSCQFRGAIACYENGRQPCALKSSVELLGHVLHGQQQVSNSDLQRLLAEVANSAENDALCLDYRRGWTRRLQIEYGGQAQQNFLSALRMSDLANPALLLEQWGALGHPWHPNYKTKMGLCAGEVMALSPEFEARIQVRLAAIRADVVRVTSCHDALDYQQWFASTYPEAWDVWSRALKARGEQVEPWLPLPLHPYQAQRTIPERFAKELQAKHLLMLEGVAITAHPSMSFRTVVPEGSARLPHMKLPVSLRLTSVERTVSPKSVVMGPRLTRLLRNIVAQEGGFGDRLSIVGEEVGLHYLDPQGNDDRARHLSVLYRVNPMAFRTTDRFPVPVGALFAESPLHGRPLVTDLVGGEYGDHAAGAETFFSAYLSVALHAVLAPYLLYGIAFEAHQQNSFVIVDAKLRPTQLLIRDFGDLRIHAPSLRRSGHALQAYSAAHTLFESSEAPRDKLLHAFMLCHLTELGLLLARTYGRPEAAFMRLMRQHIEEVFAQLRSRTDPLRWQTERQALLEHDWPAKSFIRMRLCDASEDVVQRMANPFKVV